MVNTEDIIRTVYKPDSQAFRIIMEHSRCVADKALGAARNLAHLGPDLVFIEEAALLHDIGIIRTHAPKIGCHGNLPYVFHGVQGREILEGIGLPGHGLVAERHTVAGITKETILSKGLGLPARDMIPISLEEEIICYADKFFSKTPGKLTNEKTMEEILDQLSRYGEDQVRTFKQWHERFGYSHGQ
ncbi:MAG: HDIG domain-containing protein [Proteobacteria bacterium]|nr:HDIG domain-containing protein [Pseudomonadota bacterium]